MESFVKRFLNEKGYVVNTEAQSVIKVCDDWYANKMIPDFHKRKTVQGVPYELKRLGFAKRCCADDANLCEVLEINAGKEKQQNDAVNTILKNNEFNTQYRKQLEKTSASGTTACYIRLDNATIYDNNTASGGNIRLNYVEAENFIPLTVENDIVTEAAFCGNSLHKGKKRTTLVMFTLEEHTKYRRKGLRVVKNTANLYKAETHVFDECGTELQELASEVYLGEVKPFAVMKVAEVNNLDNMEGYGLPKLINAIPILEIIDLCFNVLFGDLDKADKLLIVNDIMCKFDENGEVITPNEQAKKLFVLIGQDKLPDAKELVTEYNPKIRIEELTKVFELALSLLSMMFGYGTKKYTFENGQITTATEYLGQKQDQMQELNRQRQEAIRYIQDICKAIMWFSNTFHGTTYNLDEEILVNFDDSYITDKESELERKRDDATSFDVPELLVWYLMDAYKLTEKEARALVMKEREAKEQDADGEEED